MKPIFPGAAVILAALCLSACGGDAGQGDDTETVPAGTQPAPTAQQQAGPQTGSNTPSAAAAEAPAPGETGGRSYDTCMRQAGAAKSEGEREVMERTCRGLPGSPKVSPAGDARP